MSDIRGTRMVTDMLSIARFLQVGHEYSIVVSTGYGTCKGVLVEKGDDCVLLRDKSDTCILIATDHIVTVREA